VGFPADCNVRWAFICVCVCVCVFLNRAQAGVCFTHVKAPGEGALPHSDHCTWLSLAWALIPVKPSPSGCTYNFSSRPLHLSPGLLLLLLLCCWQRKAADLHIRSICCTAGAAGVAAVARRRRRRSSLVTASRIAQDMPLRRGRPCILEYKQNKRSLARSLSLSLSLGPASDKPLARLH
jgi:hypothetical protein